MRQLIDDLEILGKYEQPRILLIDQLAHCHISLQAGKDHYAVQSWSVEDAERLVIWLGMWLAAETGNATFEAECAALRTQRDNLRAALAAATQRAEVAEAQERLAVADIAATERRMQADVDFWTNSAGEWKQRAEAAEARLAAVPTESLRRIFEAWQMGGQALQRDIDAVFGWLAQQDEVQP